MTWDKARREELPRFLRGRTILAVTAGLDVDARMNAVMRHSGAVHCIVVIMEGCLFAIRGDG
jgi:hypothetical protein